MLKNMTEVIVDNNKNMDCESGSLLEEPKQVRTKRLLIHTHTVLESVGTQVKCDVQDAGIQVCSSVHNKRIQVIPSKSSKGIFHIKTLYSLVNNT